MGLESLHSVGSCFGIGPWLKLEKRQNGHGGLHGPPPLVKIVMLCNDLVFIM